MIPKEGIKERVNRTWYKIVDEDKPGVFKTLFHGINRSRLLRFGEWLKADIKDVTDGSCQTAYKSGFHIAPSYEECIDYLKAFKHIENKRIVKCMAINVWPKSHSRHEIYLAEYINIKEACEYGSQEKSNNNRLCKM